MFAPGRRRAGALRARRALHPLRELGRPAFPGAGIRTYSLDVSTTSDRVITTSTPMDTEATTADVVQLWRLSDLKLLCTIPFPRTSPDSTSRYPFEVRFFPDDARVHRL